MLSESQGVRAHRAPKTAYPMLEGFRTVRMKFSKVGSMQYISHLDLQRNFARVLIRAGIPVCGGDAAVCGFEIGILGASSDEVSGFQWGVLAAISKKINGLALGLFTMTDVGNGVQIGVVNVAKERGVQIGLLNFIEDSSLSFFPFVNVKF